MYLAEIHGKFRPHEERMEDILTSNVFSFFKYAQREIFLFELLNILGLNVEKALMAEAEFKFWPSYEDGTQPDLVIIVGDYYVLFEAKVNSGFGKGHDLTKHQLEREIKGGKLKANNLNKIFIFVAITAHYSKHQFLSENSEYLHLAIRWLNWHQIAILIYKVLDKYDGVEMGVRCFAEDLYSLLDKKNLRKFAGSEILAEVQSLSTIPTLLYFDPTTSKYRGDFWGFLNTFEGIPQIQSVSDSLFFGKPITRFSTNIQELIVKLPEILFFQR